MRTARLGAAAACGVAFSMVAVVPAGATTAPAIVSPEVYAGSASATALSIALDGKSATVGSGLAKVTSAATALAQGTAVNSLLGTTSSQAQASRSTPATTDGPRCVPVIPLVVLTISNACTTSSSSLAGGLGTALTRDTVDGVQVNINSVLQSTPLGQPLTQVLQPIVNQLPTPTQLDPVKNTIGGVLSDVLQTPTAQLTLGDSTSNVTTTAAQVVATGTAAGGQLDVLPAPAALNNKVAPLASVVIGSSRATATYDRQTGKATPSVDPALVTVKLGQTPLSPAVSIPVTVGQSQTVTLPAGIGSLTVQVAGGTTATNPDGSVTATANAVKLALTVAGQPVIDLAVAGAQATVAGAPAVLASPAPASPAVPATLKHHPASLPHTGGSPWIAFAGAGALVAWLATRRLLAARS